MTSTRPRSLSVAEMQAALAAGWHGEFAGPDRERTSSDRGQARQAGASVAVVGRGSSLGDRAGAGGRRTGTRSGGQAEFTSQRRVEPVPPVPAVLRGSAALAGPVVLVLAGHAGAGASAVALLLGEAAAGAGVPTRLIECADPIRSGLATATDAELGEDPSGWRCGRRGRLEIDRLSSHVAEVDEVIPPRRADSDRAQASLAVVDAGWPAWDVLAGASWMSRLLTTADVLVVCRATVPGVRQTEQLLAALPGPAPLTAAVGPARWASAVKASCGPMLSAARAADRIVPVPLNRQLEMTGLTAGPLPKQLTAAGRWLASRVLRDLHIEQPPAPTG
jgi:hypothetical protein